MSFLLRSLRSFAANSNPLLEMIHRSLQIPFRLLFYFLACWSCHAFAVDFESLTAGSNKFTVCRVNLKQDHLDLFLNDDAGRPLKSFSALNAWLAKGGKTLEFAMNAGMYRPDHTPCGLFVENGRQLSPLNLAQGTGNFFLRPNGVFLMTPAGARIVPSEKYTNVQDRVLLATQSGPMLVLSGTINPLFTPGSLSRHIRNGVGVASPDEAIFVIAETSVDFYDFAAFFRDVLHCPNALYFDGTVSSLYAPKLGRSDRKIDLGPMIGVTE